MTDLQRRCLTANVAALRRWDAPVAERIAAAGADPEIIGQPARDGSASIVARHSGGTPVQLHSRYRPADEARRAATDLPAVATCIVHGMGAAFIPRAYLARHRSSCVIVTERSHATVHAILREIDLAAEFQSGRLRVAVAPDELVAAIEAVHLPMIRDGVHSFELASWVSRDGNRDRFATLHEVIPTVLKRIAEDVATMQQFGRPWLAHTVENTFRISWETVSRRIDEFRRTTHRLPARVLAAGPGLDAWFAAPPPPTDDSLPEIAVDTALPAIAARHRRVLAVMSLDPQGWSPLHFRRRPFPAAYLCADLGISPLVVTTGTPTIPILSNHPLHRLLRNHGFPMLSAAARTNVTEAAVTVLRSLGSTSVDVIGADFGYPRGKTYARGTYHYTLALQQARRISPQESFFAAQVYPNTQIDTAGSVPVFRRGGMENAARSLRRALTEPVPAPAPENPVAAGSPPPPSARFWEAHLEELNGVVSRLEHAGPRSTPEILELLGDHGRSHLPVLPALEALAHRRGYARTDVAERISSGLTEVRAFIFSHLCRYSK